MDLRYLVCVVVFVFSISGGLLALFTTRQIPDFYCESTSCGASLHMMPSYLLYPLVKSEYSVN
jgi:hypothetical protein